MDVVNSTDLGMLSILWISVLSEFGGHIFKRNGEGAREWLY
jgi:hypothetical protein